LKRFLIIGGALVLALTFYAVSLTQTLIRTTKQTAEGARAERAASVLKEIMEAPDQGIPEALLKKAFGIAVIPHVVKGAFGIGGRYSKGLVAKRNADGGWETPLFIEIGGGSFGVQVGVEAADVVIVFTNSDGIKPLLKGKPMIGADASATAYSYSRSKGLSAGIALDGVVIQLDGDANRNVYGKKPVAADLSKRKGGRAAMAVVQPFLRALQNYAPAQVTKT
jgi:lipid-binding SYLF domain-containing protein